jgi:organic radical activating enzyme
MAKYEWSEVFMSIEGEGPKSGFPTAYIRFARCNFTCGRFNNPDNNIDDKRYAVLDFDPADITSLSQMKPVEVGCDTQYSVNPKFSHIWKKGTEDDLVEELMNIVPHNQWANPHTGLKTILSLTGGEPTQRWKTLSTLLNHPRLDDLETVLFETNCAVPFKPEFIDSLSEWIKTGQQNGVNRKIIWSNSPKLSASGEPWEKAIIPDIAVQQREVLTCVGFMNGSPDNYMLQYFKFVCGPKQRDFDEVEKAMEEYYAAGIPRSVDVLIMPESCTEEQQIDIAADVADMCIDKGFIYCHRVHNSVYANAIGK